MSTAIASWGNSEAIRIPQDMLRRAGLHKGDRVTFEINERGNLEIVPEEKEHRHVAPARGVTYESLFKDYDVSAAVKMPMPEGECTWPDDDMAGAEYEAWSR